MTERGLPLADGAPACPFVAFEDDRDERASVPDHRHRCYADARPSPRALAHQEAYCLSSAFPVCPTFQDWARREAARSRGGAPTAPSASAGMNRAASGAVADGPDVVADGADVVAAARGAAPVSGAGVAADHDLAELAAAVGPADPGSDRPAPDRSTAGRPAEAADPDTDDDQVRRNPPRDWAAPPPWLASSDRRRLNDDADPPAFLGRRASEPGQGLAGSPADRMAGGSPPPRRADGDGDDWSSQSRSAAAVGAGLGASGSGSRARPGSDDPSGEDFGIDGDIHGDRVEGRIARRPRAYAQHLGGPDGPDWEQPRRYEAYPVIRSRVGMPGIPRLPPIAVLAGLVLVVAAALFLLPGLLNFGGSSARPAGSPVASQPAVPSASLAPTLPPEPTPGVYTIKKGDVLTKIAAQHGITIEELLAANPTIKNPNRISEGQQIIIPLPSSAPPNTIGGSAAP